MWVKQTFHSQGPKSASCYSSHQHIQQLKIKELEPQFPSRVSYFPKAPLSCLDLTSTCSNSPNRYQMQVILKYAKRFLGLGVEISFIKILIMPHSKMPDVSQQFHIAIEQHGK